MDCCLWFFFLSFLSSFLFFVNIFLFSCSTHPSSKKKITKKGYVKGSAKYSYAGVVATFTFPIILYGGEDDDEVQDSALSRIELTFIGICCVC